MSGEEKNSAKLLPPPPSPSSAPRPRPGPGPGRAAGSDDATTAAPAGALAERPPSGPGPAVGSDAATTAAPAGALAHRSPSAPGPAAPHATRQSAAVRQLSELPRDELETLAESFGVDPDRHKSPQELVAAIYDRRQLIAAMDRAAMLDVVRWGRRPVTINATKEQIAQEIARIRSMKFSGLSQRGLLTLAQLRGVEVQTSDPVPQLVRQLKRQEGLFARLGRKRRAFLGKIVSGMIGDGGGDDGGGYQFLPPSGGTGGAGGAGSRGGPGSIKDDIEESGLIGGIAGRIKKSADSYLNLKLDEIEARIDRKLDEIDRRLAEWRDKEIANRLRILKITLWASVVVALVSLIYTYVQVYFVAPR